MENEEFNDAFAEFSAETPAEKPEQPTEVIETPQEEAQIEQPQEEELTLEEARRQLAELKQYKSSNEGRVGGLQRKINDLTSQISTLASKPIVQEAPPKPAPVPDPEWQQFHNDLPEIALYVDKRVKAVETSAQAEVQSLKQALADREQQERNRRAQEAHEASVSALIAEHPDAPQIAGSHEFKEWLSNQPRYLQAAYNSPDASDASDILTRYKQSKQTQVAQIQQIRDQRQQQLSQSAGVPTRRSPPAPVSRAIPETYEDAFKFFANRSKG